MNEIAYVTASVTFRDNLTDCADNHSNIVCTVNETSDSVLQFLEDTARNSHSTDKCDNLVSRCHETSQHSVEFSL